MGTIIVNIVDYNFGVDAEHVKSVSSIIEKAKTYGWMAEMNIELLDNDELLESLKRSGCKMIYCGLESVSESSLSAVNKQRTNHVENYQRIIKKAQSFGINIAAGIIIGLDNTKRSDYKETIKCFQDWGIAYLKITFITYNPCSKIHAFHSKKNRFITDKIEQFDGNQVTYLPENITENELNLITIEIINEFYSFNNSLKRINRSANGFLNKIELILFNYCYSRTYKEWINNEVFFKEKARENLLIKPYSKSFGLIFCERLLNIVRRLNTFFLNN